MTKQVSKFIVVSQLLYSHLIYLGGLSQNFINFIYYTQWLKLK